MLLRARKLGELKKRKLETVFCIIRGLCAVIFLLSKFLQSMYVQMRQLVVRVINFFV